MSVMAIFHQPTGFPDTEDRANSRTWCSILDECDLSNQESYADIPRVLVLILFAVLARSTPTTSVTLPNQLRHFGALTRATRVSSGSPQAGPKVAAIFSVVESCRRLRISVRAYLAAILSGLAESRNQTATGVHSLCLGH